MNVYGLVFGETLGKTVVGDVGVVIVVADNDDDDENKRAANGFYSTNRIQREYCLWT